MMIRIGISGWTYAPWRGVFFPPDLVQRRELEYASRIFPTIEINGTHYSLQRPEYFEQWRAATPEGFVFSVKGSRYITHMKGLRNVETPLANFFASGVLGLGEKLGPFLWQFPPRFQCDLEKMEAFFALLPRDTGAAARLARRHDDWLKGRACTKPGTQRPLRHCVEVRHESFMNPEFFRLLRREKIAFVAADTAGKWPYAEELTADFAYARLHGDEELYTSGYTDDALDDWAARIRGWSAGRASDASRRVEGAGRQRKPRDIFVYFDNDVKAHAPFDASRLASRLDLPTPPLHQPTRAALSRAEKERAR